MGKMKRSSRGSRERCGPTGLPSLKDVERELDDVSEVALPVLEKLSSAEAADREWSCRSVAHLLCEADAQQTLLNHRGLPRSLIPLLLDGEWGVREAAAGALRNLSSVGGDAACEALVRDDVMTSLSAALRQCVSRLQKYPVAGNNVPVALPTPPSPSAPPHSSSSPSPSVGNPVRGKGKAKREASAVDLHHILATVEQSLHLLLNISEGCGTVVGLANREEIVPLLLCFLQPSLFFPDILTTAAMCLYTLTEDNPPSHLLLTSTPSHLAQLEALLAPPSTSPQDQKHMLLMATATAGVFQHVLPSLPAPPPSPLVASLFSVLSSALDTDVASLLTTLTSTPPHTPPQGGLQMENSPEVHLESVLDEVESVFTAQLLALEVIANFCYSGSEEGEWKDVEEEEEVIGGDPEAQESGPMEIETHQQAPDWLAAVLVELGMVERVWKKCCPPLTPTLSPQLSSVEARWREVQTRGMGALQNMLLALPRAALSPSSALAMWRAVVERAGSGGVVLCEEVTGLLAVLVGVMGQEEMQSISAGQLEVLSGAGREKLANTEHHQLVVDIIRIMGSVGRQCLHLPLPLQSSLLEVVGRTLRDCVSCGQSEWVVARALDALYDVFGADECPVQVFSNLQIMPALKIVAAQLSDRVSVKRKELGAFYGEVMCARDNLRPFIDYMDTRTSSSL